MRFSQRIGSRETKVVLEREQMSVEMRNTLWNLIREFTFESKSEVDDSGYRSKQRTKFYRHLYLNFFKWPVDELPVSYGSVVHSKAIQIVRKWFFKAEWDLAFDMVECCIQYDNNAAADTLNHLLRREQSAYRYIEGKLVEVNSEEEVKEIDSALNNSDNFAPVRTHLQRAVELLADRNNPDYRNSIKESISSVECLARIITGKPKATLGQALKEIKNSHKLPESLKVAFSALYGYTSEEGGIRHALIDSETINMEEARFMLVACSAFVNYLQAKVS